MKDMKKEYSKKAIAVLGILFCIIGFSLSSLIWTTVISLNEEDEPVYIPRDFNTIQMKLNTIFPIHNQTVVLTNGGYVSDIYDWENNLLVLKGGWIINVNNSDMGFKQYLYDGWDLWEYRPSGTLNIEG
jgi:hypothetical protein